MEKLKELFESQLAGKSIKFIQLKSTTNQVKVSEASGWTFQDESEAYNVFDFCIELGLNVKWITV